MRHDWIFDVLTDMKAYALANGMIALAAKVDETLLVAKQDAARAEDIGDPRGSAPADPKSE